MKIYNNTTNKFQDFTKNATPVASKGVLKIKAGTYSNMTRQEEIVNKFLNTSSIQKFLEKYDVRLLFKTKKTYDSLYGKHYISTFKVKKKPIKRNFLSTFMRTFLPGYTIYKTYYESGECRTRIETNLADKVLSDFDNIVEIMKSV